MPCMCWYEPPEESKKLIKLLCEQIVAEVKKLELEGDPYDCRIDDIKKLIEHLYDPKSCNEKKIDAEKLKKYEGLI